MIFVQNIVIIIILDNKKVIKIHIIRIEIISVFEIKIYETSAGNRPFEKYIEKLLKQHKEDEVYEIRAYLNKLKEFGSKINENFKPMAIKPLR